MKIRILDSGTRDMFVARPCVITNNGSCASSESDIYFLMKHTLSCGDGTPRKEPTLMRSVNVGGTSEWDGQAIWHCGWI